jgi:hypothetical protein
VRIDAVRRRALINGGIAAGVTFLLGIGVVSSLAGGRSAAPSPSPSATSTTPPPPPCQPSWEVEQSADPGGLSNWLLGVTTVTRSEAWAVGASGDPAAPLSVLIERWNGTAWTAEQGPTPGTQVNELLAVSAFSPNDVWAAGRENSGFGDRPVVLHFDGTQWLDVGLPSDVTGVLNGIVATAPDDVWAVGYTGDPVASLEHALILHWDGQLWARVEAGRAVGQGASELRDVEALAANDVWAVGFLHHEPLIVHYDGTQWTRSETEVTGTANAIHPVTATDVWVAGQPIQRFADGAWGESAPARSDGELFGITAVNENDVWAVGMQPVSHDATKTLVMRFDGLHWKVVAGPGVAGSDALTGIASLSDGTLLGVGYKDVAAGRRTLAVLGTSCEPPS